MGRGEDGAKDETGASSAQAVSQKSPAEAQLRSGWSCAAAGTFALLALHLVDAPRTISSLRPQVRPGATALIAGLLILGALIAYGMWQRVRWALALGFAYSLLLLLSLLAAVIGGRAMKLEREILPQTPLDLAIAIAQAAAAIAVAAGAALVWTAREPGGEAGSA